MEFTRKYDYAQYYKGWHLIKKVAGVLGASFFATLLTLLFEALLFHTNAYQPNVDESTRNLRLVLMFPVVCTLLVALSVKKIYWPIITQGPDEVAIRFDEDGIKLSTKYGSSDLGWSGIRATKRRGREFRIEVRGNIIRIPSRLLDDAQTGFIRSKVLQNQSQDVM